MASGKRTEGETFADYRLRLQMKDYIDKLTRKGTMFWDSAKKGTYKKDD